MSKFKVGDKVKMRLNKPCRENDYAPDAVLRAKFGIISRIDYNFEDSFKIVWNTEYGDDVWWMSEKVIEPYYQQSKEEKFSHHMKRVENRYRKKVAKTNSEIRGIKYTTIWLDDAEFFLNNAT